MLSKLYRLPQDLIKNFPGTKIRGQLLMVLYQTSTSPHDRLATIISKKVYPKAHDRNHLKRLIHEGLRPLVDLSPNFDYLIVIYPHPPTPEAITSELVLIIAQLKHQILDPRS